MSAAIKRAPLAERLKKGLTEGIEFARGDRDLATTVVPSGRSYSCEEVVSIRTRRRMSQAQFAKLLAVNVKTLQSWEQGVRKPSKPTMRLLQIFDQPEEFRRVLVVRESVDKAVRAKGNQNQNQMTKKLTRKEWEELKYPIQIEQLDPEEGEGWVAFIPALGKGLFMADGDTVEEAINALEARRVEMYDVVIESGVEIPLPSQESAPAPTGGWLQRTSPQFHTELKAAAK